MVYGQPKCGLQLPPNPSDGRGSGKSSVWGYPKLRLGGGVGGYWSDKSDGSDKSDKSDKSDGSDGSDRSDESDKTTES